MNGVGFLDIFRIYGLIYKEINIIITINEIHLKVKLPILYLFILLLINAWSEILALDHEKCCFCFCFSKWYHTPLNIYCIFRELFIPYWNNFIRNFTSPLSLNSLTFNIF